MSRIDDFDPLVRSARHEMQMDPGRRRFFVTALACGAAVAGPSIA